VPTERRFPVLPTMLTLGNAFCGFAAITYAARVGPDLHTAEMYLQIAAMYIFGGMAFDALDGTVARWTHQQSEFGAQLDSLCDVVTFGVAPAFLLRQFSADSFLHSRIIWGIGALYVVCAILRLARFNTDIERDDSHSWFAGLPTPGAAAVVASFPIAMYAVRRWLAPGTAHISEFARELTAWLNPALIHLLPLVTLAVACLMVTQLRYPHIMNQLTSRRRSRSQLIQIVFTVVIAFVVGEMIVLLASCWFAFATPLRLLWSRSIPRFLQRSPAPSQRS
jgi:CDP-diacylglycerol---serine O-phosphatidyltransferase